MGLYMATFSSATIITNLWEIIEDQKLWLRCVKVQRRLCTHQLRGADANAFYTFMVSALWAFKAALPWGDYLSLCQHVQGINELERHLTSGLHSAEVCVREALTNRPAAPSAASTVAWERRCLTPGREGPSDLATEPATLLLLLLLESQLASSFPSARPEIVTPRGD